MKWIWITALVILGFAGTAEAAVLDQNGLDQLQLYVSCKERCDLGKVATRTTCMQTCGTPQTAWNKNLDSGVDRKDYQLALLEFWDAGTLTKICYEGGAVVPKGQCGGSDCLASHTAAECADNDHDGIRAWQEALVGTSDNQAQRICSSGAECNGFTEQCTTQDILGLSYCTARTSLTAFHLDKIEENANEIVVDVVFDYSPVPPTILDLYLEFDGTALVLTESRALSAAKKAGKSVEVRQAGDNVLRIIALGAADARTIDPGPIAELVFSRKSSAATSIQFSSNTVHREDAMAPTLGAQQPGLLDNSAWGPAVSVKSASDATEGHIVLHYDFEAEQRPLAESSALKSVDACTYLRLSSGQSILTGDCPTEPAVPAAGAGDPTYVAAKQRRDRWIQELDALQRGTAVTAHHIDGVSGFGSWFDGSNDHLEFPLTFNQPATTGASFQESAQSFSISFWMLQTASLGEEVLFSRNDQSSEQTKFALLSRPGLDVGKFDLLWLDGALSDSSAARTSLLEGLPVQKWTHVGLSVNATLRMASVYVDGALAKAVPIASGAVTACPQIQPTSPARLTLHEEGDFGTVAGTGPESIFFGAMGGNGLSGIDALDASGLGRRTVLRLGDSFATQPDYHPGLDRVVYASNASGDSEIWIANGDGSHAQQITKGFGRTADGVFAARPRWAPDGSAIVFESNAYSLSPDDNIKSLGYQLYYIGYNAQTNAVAIPVGSSFLSQLVYDDRLAAGDLSQYRLTRTDEEVDNSNAQWVNGKTGSAELALGEIAFTTTDSTGNHARVRRIQVANSYGKGDETAKVIISYTADPAIVDNRRLLAAKAIHPAGQPALERALLSEQKTDKVGAPEISTVATAAGTCPSGSGTKVSIRYQNPSPAANCWDKNLNGVCDPGTEDRNIDGHCDTLDCNASQLEEIFIGYDRTSVIPDMTTLQPGAWIQANGKKIFVKQVFDPTGDAVRIEVSSQVNSLPIPDGTELATLQFCGAANPAFPTPTKLKTTQKFWMVQSLTAIGATTPVVTSTAFTLDDPRMQNVTGAEFSPNLGRLALSVIFDARPMLFRTKDLNGTAGADLLTTDPVRVDGMSWTGVNRLYACNWMAGVRNPTTKLYKNAFEGAFDEIKVADYARSDVAFRSEAERGHERLAQDGRDGIIGVEGVTCNGDADCKSTELCNQGRCGTVNCNPNDPASCSRGRCQRLPVEVSATEQYACVAECLADSACLEKQCANGPCRICNQKTHTCGECQQIVDNVGGLRLEYIQGCPDRNSFTCDTGTCVSECYSFDHGQSKYLCDPATEYCRAGRCALFDWNWADLSPVSLAGAGEMALKAVGQTVAYSQLYAIEVQALGVPDNAIDPELLVEGKAPNIAGGNWFDIGRIKVQNETHREALNHPYRVNTPYPLTDLRIRTIVPAFENIENGAMGLPAARISQFCNLTPATRCRFTPPSSRATLGYEAWIPGWTAKCKADSSACIPEELKYLGSGVPVVLVLDVKVKDQDFLPVDPTDINNPQPGGWVNKMCPYWDGAQAVAAPVNAATGVRNLMIYGDASREVSPQKARYYPNAPATSLVPVAAGTKGFAVLNCNYFDDTGSAVAAAGLEIHGLTTRVRYNDPANYPLDDKHTIETANGCFVNLGTPTAPRNEPCYEWTGADVSFDPLASEPQPYRTLTLSRFRSFGWGNGSDKLP